MTTMIQTTGTLVAVAEAALEGSLTIYLCMISANMQQPLTDVPAAATVAAIKIAEGGVLAGLRHVLPEILQFRSGGLA
jgi:hypothetical protein